MKKLYEIRSDLYSYVGKYNDLLLKTGFLQGNNSFYEELLRILNDCLSFNYSEIFALDIYLETLYGTKYNDLIDNVFCCKRLKKFNGDEDEIKILNSLILKSLNEIKEDYLNNKKSLEFFHEKLYSKKERYIVARRVQTCLKYKQIIKKNDIGVLSDILREIGYSNNDIASIIENVFVRNKSLVTKMTGTHFNVEEKYKFLNLLSLGGEKFVLPDVLEPIKLNKFVESIWNIFDTCSKEDIVNNYIDFLPEIGKELRNVDELKFVLIGVLDKIRNSFDEKIELIKDPDFIMDLEIKNELADECYGLIDNYNLIRNYMDNVVSSFKKEIIDDSISEKVVEKVPNFFYLVSNFDKCYLLDDIENMPYEYISKVKELMDDFKNNCTLDKSNKILPYKGGFAEIKGDQIRIMYKRINNNDYLFYGAFIKKDDWKYRIDFNKIIGRSGKISENSSEIEEKINNYIKTNQRKWSR